LAAIVFDKVSKRFGSTYAVSDFSLEVADGEFLVLVGPSGCGKSTALRLLAGLEELTSGEIYIGDRPVKHVQPKDRDVAMVFQSYALYPHMTAFDNMAFGLKLHSVEKDERARRVQEASQLLGIGHLLQRKPGQLSGGQRQRVALGRAIVREPAAFLLDEPLSNLDAQLRVQTRAELRHLHERLGSTFVYVTHDQVEAMTMADRIAVMKEGMLQQVGTPGELYERPNNVFVAGFIGSPAMNFFRASVERQGEGLALVSDGLRLPLPAGSHVDVPERNVIAGIRPEDVYDPAFPRAGFDPSLVDCRVDIVEPTGGDTYLHVLAGSNQFVARVEPRTAAKPGEAIKLAFNLQRLHLFDAESQTSLREPEAGA
jgi:multiple sugar transport system ATP-binding protein